ncbi:MAG: RNA-binding S4 domain-containing protein [Myxococcota bacterium]|nr:RNA-binding S4 domain-containing protein [Myxococcota bacterium]
MTQNPPDIVLQLDRFLKRENIVQSGGEAKILIQTGRVKLNGEVETRRKKKIQIGDLVEIDGQEIQVT